MAKTPKSPKRKSRWVRLARQYGWKVALWSSAFFLVGAIAEFAGEPMMRLGTLGVLIGLSILLVGYLWGDIKNKALDPQKQDGMDWPEGLNDDDSTDVEVPLTEDIRRFTSDAAAVIRANPLHKD